MKRILLASTILAAFGCVMPAQADLIFNLTAANSGITSGPGGGVGPYGTVDVHRNSTTSATITFTQLGVYDFLDGGSAAVNVNGPFTLGAITGTAAPGATQATYSNGGAGNEDGFGSFNLTINSSDGWASRSAAIVFTITDTGAPWLTDGSVLAFNSQHALGAAHVGFNGGANTGFAAGSGDPTPPTNTPEPVSIALLGVGLLGLGVARRRRQGGASV